MRAYGAQRWGSPISLVVPAHRSTENSDRHGTPPAQTAQTVRIAYSDALVTERPRLYHIHKCSGTYLYYEKELDIP